MTNIVTFKNDVLVGHTKTSKTLEEIKEIKETDGAVCYEITDQQYEDIQKGYDVSINNGIVETIAGELFQTKEQERINREARAYLKETDWYVTRMIETGVEVPADITAKRQEERNKII